MRSESMGAMPQQPTQPEELLVANDNGTVESQNEMKEVLQRVLSSDAWTLFEGLSLAPTYEGFVAGVAALNNMGETQLNREGGVGRDLENETLASRQIEATITLRNGRILHISRDMRGLFTFTAVGAE